MSNSIFHYSCIETVLDENYTPGLSHAMLDSAEASLCGIGRNHFGSAIYSGLARVDGQVGCKDCMAELERLNLVGGYAGPRTFVMEGIRNFWLIKCQRCKEENLSQRII